MKNEVESKSLIKSYGIKTTEPYLAVSAEDAEAYASCHSGPFAMKIVSSDIVHKVAAGGVRLDVMPDGVYDSYVDIIDSCLSSNASAKLDGVLLECMIKQGIEVFIGARVDQDYGSVVLLGLGGSNVEIGRPPAACLAPLSEELADELMVSAFPEKLAEQFGQLGWEKLREYLMIVAGPRGIIFNEDVGEIDINPIIISNSSAIAVDCVVGPRSSSQADRVLGDSQVLSEVRKREVGVEGLSSLFEPKSIAVIGASATDEKLGNRIINNLIEFGYKGNIFPIHPSAEKICGLRAYSSVSEVAGSVDRAYISVPASKVPQVVMDCANNQVQVAQVLTAGFAEFDNGESLDLELKSSLNGSGMRMVGPNCIGAFSGAARIPLVAPRYSPTAEYGVTFIGQSGTYAGDVCRRAQVLGIPVAQVLSCGNCSDLDFIDYLIFCESNPRTSVIAFYIESLKDPGLFFRVARNIKKPIVIFRGGSTDQGHAAASSHTAALATDQALWEAAVKQAGVLEVHGIEELMDLLLIHSAHSSHYGRRLAIFGSGGGVSVTSSDVAARLGMEIPTLSDKTRHALEKYGVAGTSVRNPIDLPIWDLHDGESYIFKDMINLLKDDENVDGIIVYVEAGYLMDFSSTDEEGLRQLEMICASVASSKKEGAKLSLVLRSSGDKLQDDLVREQRKLLVTEGIAVFSSASRAVRAHAMLNNISKKIYRS